MADVDLSQQVVEPAAKPRQRPPEDLAALGLAVQANLVTLKVADAKRQGIEVGRHPLAVPAPGAVLRFRDTLLDREAVKRYDDVELRLRLHEIWGQFCLLNWLFYVDDPHHPADFARTGELRPPRCGAVLDYKTAEIEGSLWRMHYEQRYRHDPSYRPSPDFEEDTAVARRIPVMVFGRPIDSAGDDELLVCSCEYAGMLAAVRWAADDRCPWGAPGIMAVWSRPAVATRMKP